MILHELNTAKSLWDLLAVLHYPIKDVLKAIKELREEGFIKVAENGFELIDKGKGFVKSVTKYTGNICSACQGKRVVLDDAFNEVLNEFKKLVKDRPQPSSEFFQGYMKEEDVINRIAFMHHYRDVADKEIVLIGDDDLVSVALSLTGLPKRICVLDIDERIGSFLKALRKHHGLEIEFRKYDVSENLPPDLISSFDVFSSEPLETLSGLRVFLGRGISCLKEDGVGYFGLTVLEASYRKWRAVQNFLLRSNCVITDVVRDFSRYPMQYETVDYENFANKLGLPSHGRRDWYKSTLFRFEVLGKPKILVNPNKKIKVQSIDKNEDLTHPLLDLDVYRL
ncbi:MAG: bis-aminopropyl spermidine synthase family protein [Nitrososphaerales archaeon]